jgi:hypothetical protein
VVSSPPPSREDALRAELARILETTDYRLGLIVLTYPEEPGKGFVRHACALMLKNTIEGEADLAALPERLRALASELEGGLVRGKARLPPPGEPHPPQGAKCRPL